MVGHPLITVERNAWYVCLEKKNKKDESKAPNVKEKNGDEEKKKGKPKAHAPSHAKIRSIGRFGRRSELYIVFKVNCV